MFCDLAYSMISSPSESSCLPTWYTSNLFCTTMGFTFWADSTYSMQPYIHIYSKIIRIHTYCKRYYLHTYILYMHSSIIRIHTVVNNYTYFHRYTILFTFIHTLCIHTYIHTLRTCIYQLSQLRGSEVTYTEGFDNALSVQIFQCSPGIRLSFMSYHYLICMYVCMYVCMWTYIHTSLPVELYCRWANGACTSRCKLSGGVPAAPSPAKVSVRT